MICREDNRCTRETIGENIPAVSIREEENYGIITVIEKLQYHNICLHYNAHNRVIYLMTCVAVYNI